MEKQARSRTPRARVARGRVEYKWVALMAAIDSTIVIPAVMAGSAELFRVRHDGF